LNKKTFLVLLLFVITIMITAAGCGPSEPTSVDLKAKVSTDGQYLIIENDDDFVWNNVKITINDEYVYRTDFIAKGKSSIMLSEFTKDDGERFNPEVYKLKEVFIYVPKAVNGKDGFFSGAWK